APARHAVNVGPDFDPRQVEEFLPRPRKLSVDRAEAPKGPRLQVGARCLSIGEDGPLLREDLAGRQALSSHRLFHAICSSLGVSLAPLEWTVTALLAILPSA